MNKTHTEWRDDWRLNIDADAVLRAQGADAKRIRVIRPRLVTFIEAVMTERIDRIQPKAAIRRMQVRNRDEDCLLLDGGIELRGRLLCTRLQGAESVAVVVATIGELEQIGGIEADRDPLRRLILDGLGTAAIMALSAAILRELQASAATQNQRTTNPLYPGTNGWELSIAQAQVFSIVDGRVTGVELNSSSMMTPHKSVSFLLGIGHTVADGPTMCAECAAAAQCRHKPKPHVC
jgi:hypothetical protein